MQHIGRRIASSMAWMLAGNAVVIVLSTVATLALVRYLGAQGFGDYALAAALVLTLGTVANFGTETILLRDLSRDPEDASGTLAAAMGLRLVLSGLAMLLAVGAAFVLGYSPNVRLLTFIGALIFPMAAFAAYQAVYMSRMRMDIVMMLNMGTQLAATLVTIGVIFLRGSLASIVLADTMTRALGVLLTAWLGRSLVPWRFSFAWPSWRHLLIASFPLFGATILSVIYARLNILLLGILVTPALVGLYSVASRTTDLLSQLSASFMASVYPVLSRHAIEAEAIFANTYRLAYRYLMIMIVPIAGLLAILARPLLGILFGVEFEDASVSLALLAWLQVFTFAATLTGSLLVIRGHQSVGFTYQLVSNLVGLAAVLVLTPRFGIEGAALGALLGSVAGVLFGLLHPKARHYQFALLGSLARTGLAILPGGFLLFWGARQGTLWMLSAAGGYFLVSLGMLFVTGSLDRSDITRAREALRRTAASKSPPGS